jgi:hypothetical protein
MFAASPVRFLNWHLPIPFNSWKQLQASLSWYLMAKYQQRIFDAFGPTAIGQAAAAIVIGALVGFIAGRKSSPADSFVVGISTAGGAGLGLIGAILLLLVEARRKRVAAGTAKPRSAVFWIVTAVIGLIFLYIVSMVVVLL